MIGKACMIGIKAIEKQKTGRWIYGFCEEVGLHCRYCSNCKRPNSQIFEQYCANCGCEMVEDEE